MGERVRLSELDPFEERIGQELKFRQKQAGLWGKWCPLAFAVFISLFIFSALQLHELVTGLTDFRARLGVCLKFLVNPLVVMSCVAWIVWRFLGMQQRAWEKEVKRVKQLLRQEAKKESLKPPRGGDQDRCLGYAQNKYHINS